MSKMYDELIKRLYECVSGECWNCSQKADDYEGQRTCADKLMKQAADAIEELQATVDGLTAQTNMVFEETEGRTVIKFEPKWIPVTERLPEQGDPLSICLIVGGKYDQLSWYELCDFAEGQFWIHDHLCDCHVTHWMPLPEPPKDGES